MVLSKNDIETRCLEQNLLENYDEKNIQTCSYDLRLGDQYYFYKEDDNETVNVSSLKPNGVLRIPPNAICYVMTEETVNMPQDLTASISLSFGLIKSGVMLAAQPPYDPGYHGKTVALLHNLSNETVEIRRGDHVLNMVFMKLTSQVSATYDGSYQGLSDLNDYCKEVKVGAVFELKQQLDKERKNLNNLLPHLLTVITVIIAVLTVLFTILVGTPLVKDLRSGADAAPAAPSPSPAFSIDEDSNVLTVTIDGKDYVISLGEHDDLPQKTPVTIN